MKRILFLVVIVLLCSTCRKKVTKVNPDYVGEWIESPRGWCESKIIIDEDNNGLYTYSSNTTSECSDNIHGIARLGDKVLVIGSRHFKLIEKATQIPDTLFSGGVATSNMRMKIKIPLWLGASGDIVTLYKKK